MRLNSSVRILMILGLLFQTNIGQAATPTMFVCIKGSAISVKQKCSSGEKKASLANLQGSQGPQGVTGAQGATGSQGPTGLQGPSISNDRCTLRDTTISGNTYVIGQVTCLENETFVSHGGYATSGTPVIANIELLKLINDSTKVGGVAYAFYDRNGGAIVAKVQAWCCH